MHPLTWNDLPSIHEVPDIDSTDRQCIEELRQVIQRHGKVRRLGVALLHQHFELADDEVLIEHCDPEQRTLLTRPQRVTDRIQRTYLPTLWRFDGPRATECGYCPKHGDQHDGYKEPCIGAGSTPEGAK